MRIAPAALAVLSLIACLILALTPSTRVVAKSGIYDAKIEAARRMAKVIAAIRLERQRLEKPIDMALDPAGSGLIFAGYSEITTDKGSLKAKQLTTHADFAALAVELLKKAHLRPGDTVAIGMSSSFPGLNLATLCAVEALELRPILISSIGASQYGATDPDLTWLDMEALLAKQGLLKTRSVAASLGGGKDNGGRLSRVGVQKALAAIERNGVELIREGSLARNIKKRLEIYQAHAGSRPIVAFVNVGANLSNIGDGRNARQLPGGLLRRSTRFAVNRGVAWEMFQKDLPVVNFLNVNEIARRYRLKAPTSAEIALGESRVYWRHAYPRWAFAVAAVIFIAALLLCVRRRDSAAPAAEFTVRELEL